MQPWLIKRHGDAITLCINHARSHNLLDVHGSAAIFSLGMLAENMLIAAGNLGYRCEIHFSSDDQHQTGNLVVTIVFVEISEPDETYRRLFVALNHRCTNRRLHTGDLYTDDKIRSLGRHFQDSGCKLSFLSSKTSKRELLRVLAENDIFRLRHPASLNQLLSEIRWDEEETTETRDGIDLKTLELPKAGEIFLKLLSRIPTLANRFPTFILKQFSKPPIIRSSHIGLVVIEDAYSDQSMFQAGKHTQRLWLMSTIENIGFQPYTVLTFNLLRVLLANGEGFTEREQAKIRRDAEQVCRIFGMPETSIPVFIFRLARAPQPETKSLRLPENSFLA